MLIALLPLAQGCVPLVIGGAATGVAVAQDRRTAGTMADDESIEAKASGRIRNRYGNGDDPHISVISYNRSVLLVGQAPDAQTKAEVERIVRGVENVRNVLDEIVVSGATSFGTRSNDALITSKVKARFIDAQKFNVLYVKVVTENGVVYLLGLVTKQEANDASEIARTTSGVQKVVRVFEYID
jgi:osmotically-inducible protein OsmY